MAAHRGGHALGAFPELAREAVLAEVLGEGRGGAECADGGRDGEGVHAAPLFPEVP
jgi:hypothetical protein